MSISKLSKVKDLNLPTTEYSTKEKQIAII